METEYSLSIYDNEDCDQIDGEAAGKYVRIDYITVAKEDRGQGHGRRLVREALAEAKTYGLPIYMVACKLTEETDLDRLVAFYESEGFDVAAAIGPSILMKY